MAMRDTTKPRNIRPAAWRRRLMPVVIWIAAVGIAGWMFVQRSGRFEAVGLARGEIRQVAALTDGRLLMLPVGLFEKVDAGQTLAVLEDDRGQSPVVDGHGRDCPAPGLNWRQPKTAFWLMSAFRNPAGSRTAAIRPRSESKRLHELELAATQNTDRVRLEYLRIKRDAYAESFNKRATSELDWKAAVAEWEAMQKQIAENDRVLAQCRHRSAGGRQAAPGVRQEPSACAHAGQGSRTTAGGRDRSGTQDGGTLAGAIHAGLTQPDGWRGQRHSAAGGRGGGARAVDPRGDRGPTFRDRRLCHREPGCPDTAGDSGRTEGCRFVVITGGMRPRESWALGRPRSRCRCVCGRVRPFPNGAGR